LLAGINGGELCGCIKRDYNVDNLPVIMMSAYPKVIASLGYYGCDDFLPKPFNLSDLLIKINHLIK
jgi:DNA-binding response OmpR family regulator